MQNHLVLPSSWNPPPTSKWSTFNCVGRETKHITKIFRRTNLKLANKTRNTIEHLLNLKPLIQDKYLKSGMYQLKYSDLSKKSVEQIGRSFYHMFKEHYQDFKTGNKRLNSQDIRLKINIQWSVLKSSI